MVDAGAGNDSIQNNFGYNVTISGGAGSDTIENVRGRSVSISGGDGADFISTANVTLDSKAYFSSGVTINGGAGNDTIQLGNEANLILYTDGDGADLITGFSASDTLQITNGKIRGISVSASDAVLYIGDGAITLKNYLSGFSTRDFNFTDSSGSTNSWTISEGVSTMDNERIYDEYANNINNDQSGIYISAMAGDDTVSNSGSEVTLDGGAGNDSILSSGNSTSVIGGTGNDTIALTGSRNIVSYSAGDGSDVITGFDESDTLQISASVDSISVTGTDAVIQIGSDTITLKDFMDGYESRTAAVVGADGNSTPITFNVPEPEPEPEPEPVIETISGSKKADTLNNENDYTVINALAGNDKIYNSGSNVTVFAGDGNDTIKNTASNVLLDGGAGKDKITSTGDNVTINGGAADDNIITEGANVLVDGGAGIDRVTITGNSANSTVLGGAGKDTFVVDADSLMVDGGADADAFTLNAEVKNVTVIGGAGNDTIRNNGAGNFFQYSSGDGNDSIIGFSANDTLYIANSAYTTKQSGDDVIITIGKNTVTLKNIAKDSVVKTSGDYITVSEPEHILPAGWALKSNGSVISATVSNPLDLDISDGSWDAVKKIDASKAKEDLVIIGHDAGISIKSGTGDDTLTGGAGDDTLTGGKGADVFVYTGGADFITDYEAGKDFIMVDVNDIELEGIETVGANLVVETSAGDFTVKGGKGKEIVVVDAEWNTLIPVPDDKILPYGWSLSTDEKVLKATIGGADNADLNDELYSDWSGNVVTLDGSAVNGGVEIIGNELDNSIKAGSGGDTLAGGAGDDTLYGGKGADVFVYTGGDDVIQNYDKSKDFIQVDFSEIEFLDTAAQTVGSDVIFETSEGDITVKNGKKKVINFIDENGEIISGDDIYNPLRKVHGWKYKDAKRQVIVATVISGADELDLNETYGEGVTTVDASKINDGATVRANDLGVSIKAGDGDDIIWGGKGNDTFTGGKGDDLFVFNGGDDIVTDFGTGLDTVKFDYNPDDVTFESYATVGANVILETSEGSVTLKGGKGKEIVFVDADDAEFNPLDYIETPPEPPYGWKFTNDTRTILQATVAGADNLDLSEDYGAKVIKVDGSKTSDGVEIIANDLGDSIKGGKGDDTIWGGLGNDTISLGGGDDVYVYTGGNDIISDFKATSKEQDAIQIDLFEVEIQDISKVGKNAVITTDVGTLTVKNIAPNKLNLIESDGTEIDVADYFASNGSKPVSGSSSSLFVDDNFISSTAQISDISEISAENYSVGQIRANNFENLAVEENIAQVYASDK